MQTVLIVDDEPMALRVVSEMLARAGYQTLVASSAKEAYRVCAEFSAETGRNIDAAVLDVVMPETRGPELMDTLKRMYPGMRGLFMSAYPQDSVFEPGELVTPVSDFLQKPFLRTTLLARIDDLLSRELAMRA